MRISSQVLHYDVSSGKDSNKNLKYGLCGSTSAARKIQNVFVLSYGIKRSLSKRVFNSFVVLSTYGRDRGSI